MLKIINYEQSHAADFKRIGEEWLNEYLQLKEPDTSLLNNPKDFILDQGGFIFMAEYKGEIVGTCSLIRKKSNRYELAKLGVLKNLKGLGIGRSLCQTVIEKARGLGIDKLYLESSQVLKPALQLYKKLGFVDDTSYGDLTPQCDVKMELILNKK